MQALSRQVPLAVIGVGCRLPGADNLDEYWQMIRDGRSGIAPLPPERLDRSLYFDPQQGKIGRTYSQIGGVVPERPLKPEICKLTQELIHNSDSAHQIMCEVAAMACRHAGYDPFNLPNRNVGVYVGHSGGSCLSGELATSSYIEEVAHYLKDVPQFSSLPADTQFATIKNIVDRVHREKAKRHNDGGPDLAAYQVAGLVSQAFKLQGPFLAVDAACASSLIAMAIGCHALRQGFIDMAIVGGASYSKWYGLVLFSMAMSISGTGSRPFDANADGLISSDGYAAVILKTLPKALADGDKIHAVIRGIGISSDGRGKSLWAPRKEGQIKAIHRAYGPDVDPAELQYIECHATSTQVGDATELGALTMALKDRLPAGTKLPIGSVKANIGHTLESAGIAGFVKTVLCMQNRMLPGQINFQTPNPDVDWANIPFEVNRQTCPWPEPPAGRARRAAVNAFGIGGLNVHVVIEDAPTDALKKQFGVGSGYPAQAKITLKDQDDRAVAIIGRAAILPGALTLDAYWDLLVSGRDPKIEVPPSRWSKEIYSNGKGGDYRFKTALGGFVNDFVYDWKKHKVPPKQINNANPLQFMLLDAADQALRESGYDRKPFDRTKTAVIVGSCFGGDFACQLQMGLRIPEFQMQLREELQKRGVPADQIEAIAAGYQKALLTHMPALLDETGSFTASTLASRLTKTFDMMGGALAMDAGDTSSLAAIHASAGLLLDGAADMVLCAAGQRNMDLNVYEIYEMKGLLASGPTKAAYDVDGGKFVPGEGVGVVLLKRLKDAQRDGDRIFGIVRGIAAATNFGEYPDNFRAAAQRALNLGGVEPSQVTVLESARFSATIADAADLQESAEIFGSEKRPEPLVMNSVVGQIGYTLGTAGMASVLKASLQMQHGQVPKNPLVSQPLPAVAELSDAIQLADQARQLYATRPGGKTIASVVNCATNGATYQLLLEGGENLPQPTQKKRQAAPVVSAPMRAIRLGAPTRDVLMAEINRIVINPDSLFATGGRDHYNGQDRVRLTVLAEDAAALAKKLRMTTEMVQRPGTRISMEQQGVFLLDVAQQAPKIAFLFPGQGSQYAGMLQQLAAEVPAAAEKVREWNGILSRLGHGTVEDICWKNAEALGSDVWTTQLSMLIANTLMHHALGSMGIRPDVVSGHSYGEIPALVAAGVLSLEDAIQVTKVRTESVEQHQSTKGALLSTTAPIEVVRRLLPQMSGVHLASHNAPDQCVIGGTQAGVAELKTKLESEGFGCKILSVPRPYHTPLLQAAKSNFESALSRITFKNPSVKFLSSVTNEYVTAGDVARRNLVEQLTTPVLFVDLVRKLATEGITIFIEAGPHQVLTRLNQRNLIDHPVSALAADAPKTPGLVPLQRIKTLLETANVKLNAAPVATPASSVPAPQKVSVNASSIVFFDATARRRSHQNGTAALAPKATAPTAVVSPQPSAAGVSSNGHAVVALNRDEVQATMINFVVDQTGYPAEMVELDADLEADLGIDSIKKAQLIGELAENYELTHLAGSLQNLSLDDFRTLRSILDFVVEGGSRKAESGSEVEEPAVIAASVAPVVAAEVPTLNLQASTLNHSSNGHTVPVEAPEATVTPLNRDEVQATMINFVVDQTGYPAEMVELDADLEADLGIDSIKKAQLIGELAENYELTHLAGSLQNLSLDDFRTLRSILDFVVDGGSRKAEGGSDVVVAAEPAVEAAPMAAVSVQPSVVSVSHNEPAVAAEAPAAVVAPLDRDEVQTTMVNFVVDQTGYPAEMVELDADLEADLGIDSIKKAQLIGELAENYELTHLAGSLQNLSLDDFRTLRSILDFVVDGGRGKAEGGSEEVAAAQPTVEVAPMMAVSPQPSAISVSSNGHAVVAEAPVAAGTPLNRDEVQTTMINFVVDQTGYPAEMVELDADLEADLGIDSIKKAQLIGELAENYELTHLAGSLQNLSLDDFRTLRSILDFVVDGGNRKAEGGSEEDQSATDFSPVSVAETGALSSSSQSAVATLPAVAVETQTVVVEADYPEGFNLVQGHGSAYEIGKQHGSNQAVQIRTIMERYASMLGPRLQNIPELEEALAKPTLYFCEDDLEELHGIADGSGLPIPALVAHNLGMYPDYVPGCTQFAVTARNNSSIGMIHAVNEDSPLSLTLPDCLSRVVQVRMPRGRIPHVTFSVSGQAGGLNGMNAMGIAVSSTLLLDRPRRAGSEVGKVHPVIVKRILERASTVEEAVDVVKSLDRVGAWSLCISHYPTDRLCYLEYDGRNLAVQENPPFVLTTNHCLLQPPVAAVPEHSKHRLARLHQLLGEGADGQWTLERSQKALRDQFDLGRGRQTTHATMNTVRRVDNQISVVMQPGLGELWVTPGPRAGTRQDEYFRFNVHALFKDVVTADQTGELSAEKIILNSASLREGLPTEAQNIVHRHVMRTAAAPLPANTPELPPLHGAAVILGEAKVSETLKMRLTEAGVKVYELPISRDIDAILNELNRIWSLCPAPHLFITTAREDAAVVTEVEWPERTQRGLQVPYFVCQRWLQLVNEAGLTKQATLAALTALGGDFGFSGRIVAIEGGGLAGLLKGIRREYPTLTVKLIDSSLEEAPAQLAASVLKELASGTPQIEVGYQRGERLVPRAIPQAASTQRRAVKVPHGNWIVTGGARGVTAVVARELGKRFGLKMQLLGSTPLPNIDPTWRNLTDEGMKALKKTTLEQARAAGKNPAQVWKDVERAIEIDRTLQAFRADGVKAEYYACDVSNRDSLSATLEQIRKAAGPIHGIIHGAGVESACKFEKKKRDSVIATLAVKVDAAMTLLDLTGFDPIGWFIGFGSTSGRFGGLGQTDYSMASDLLCKICDWAHLRRPDAASVGFHWPPWADVGMAARPESKIALQSGGLAFMPPLEGVAHVINELSTLMQEGEILCIDKPDGLDQDGTMYTPAERDGYRHREPLLRSVALIDSVQNLDGGRKLIATARLNPKVEPFLLEHRHQGVPILPAVCGMELMAEAAMVLSGQPKKVVAIKKMGVHQGFRFHTDRMQTAQVWAEKQADGIRCELRADFLDRNGRLVEPHRLQMDVTIELADEYSPLPTMDLGPVPTTWKAHKYADDWQTMKYPEDGRVYHGYPFRGIKEFALVKDGMWGKVTVPLVSDIAGERDIDGWLLPSATIDSALLGCDILLWNTIRSPRLPLGFERIRLARPLQDGEPLLYRVWLRPDNNMIADFVFMDANGHIVIHAEAFHMVEIKQGIGQVGRAELAPGANIPGTPGFIERRAFPRPDNATRVIGDDAIGQLPLIDSARWINDREVYAELKFDPVNDIFLAQHKLASRPILPAVIGMESMIQAASLALPGKCLGSVKEFQITRGMRFKTDDPQSARVRVRVENGKARCELVGGENLDQVQQSALIEMTNQPPAVAAPGPGQPPFPYNPMMYPEDGQLVHGKMFRALKQLFLQRDGGWAKVAGYPVDNMQGNRTGGTWFLPPAVLDSCLVACGVDMFVMFEKRVEVPYACEEFKLVRLPQPKEQCVLRIRYRDQTERHTTYDFTLYGADNSVIFAVTGYRGIVTGLDGDSSHWDGKNTLLD